MEVFAEQFVDALPAVSDRLGMHAEALDQSSQRADDKEASISAAQIAISAKKVDGAWRITELKPL